MRLNRSCIASGCNLLSVTIIEMNRNSLFRNIPFIIHSVFQYKQKIQKNHVYASV
ncbi:hypothetical protein DZA65_02017 [Dickeya dianthicola]|nr:hypothetical protein DZA65_02017 [Dickeya dianthicola]